MRERIKLINDTHLHAGRGSRGEASMRGASKETHRRCRGHTGNKV